MSERSRDDGAEMQELYDGVPVRHGEQQQQSDGEQAALSYAALPVFILLFTYTFREFAAVYADLGTTQNAEGQRLYDNGEYAPRDDIQLDDIVEPPDGAYQPPDDADQPPDDVRRPLSPRNSLVALMSLGILGTGTWFLWTSMMTSDTFSTCVWRNLSVDEFSARRCLGGLLSARVLCSWWWMLVGVPILCYVGLRWLRHGRQLQIEQSTDGLYLVIGINGTVRTMLKLEEAGDVPEEHLLQEIPRISVNEQVLYLTLRLVHVRDIHAYTHHTVPMPIEFGASFHRMWERMRLFDPSPDARHQNTGLIPGRVLRMLDGRLVMPMTMTYGRSDEPTFIGYELGYREVMHDSGQVTRLANYPLHRLYNYSRGEMRVEDEDEDVDLVRFESVRYDGAMRAHILDRTYAYELTFERMRNQIPKA